MKKALALLIVVFVAAVSVLAQTGGETHGGFASPIVPVQNSFLTWLVFFYAFLRWWLRF
jgi:hypothetical protein